MNTKDLAAGLFAVHQAVKEVALYHRRFKHADILPLIDQHRRAGYFDVSEIGRSFENRAIYKLSVGNGPQKILFWSQMHGDEPTATMALFDIFNFLEGSGDEFDGFRKLLSEKFSLHFVPMLNPDGAERYQRPTAQMIDMNRDALALQTPEGKILKELIDNLKPDVGFNLHDQNPRYTAGVSPKLAAISFLATSYDYQLSVNETRLKSMQLIAVMNEVLQQFIPDQIGRFSDEHEPRAFGDNIQKLGTTLVLVESGGYKGDPEKQYIRKLNFVALLAALGALAENTYHQKTRDEYESIPYNARSVYELIIRGVSIRQNGQTFKADIGIDREEVNCKNVTCFSYQSKIEGYGDLSTSYGLEEISADKLHLEEGRVYPAVIRDWDELQALNAVALLREGYVFVRISDTLYKQLTGGNCITVPFHLISENAPLEDLSLKPGGIPTFLLMEESQIRYAVVNGFIFDTSSAGVDIPNGILS